MKYLRETHQLLYQQQTIELTQPNSATNTYGIALVTAGTFAVLLVLAMFLDTLRFILTHSSSGVKAHSVFVTGVYPVISLATYLAILVPRAHLLSEAVTQGAFMSGMYRLFCLFVAYCDGEAELMKRIEVRRVRWTLRVTPCCCWPCCTFLPELEATKSSLRSLKLLVLQLPVVQGLAYLVLLVMWAERESLYQVNYIYLQPVIIISILVGIWSMTILMNVLKSTLDKSYSLSGKFIVLQLVLIFAKVQGLATRALVWVDMLPCNPPITPQVYANLLHNALMLSEMVLLGAIARYLYKKNIPEIATEEMQISTLGNIMNNNDIGRSNKWSSELKRTGIENEAVDITN
ncbi:unnamed protein product [Phaedon cochleariae]|uniref:Organic solute transporter alpha-like protein n=1 Tax=Phaedon cochleariae TaxID=80249 RepID=A0A9P0DNQ9_PHACE|nr:unnamed protein product [Phaedon cochleariae]